MELFFYENLDFTETFLTSFSKKSIIWTSILWNFLASLSSIKMRFDCKKFDNKPIKN